VTSTTNLSWLLLVSFSVAALFAGACSGSSESRFPDTVEIGDGDIQPIAANSELVTGPNRFALGLLDAKGVPLVDAKVHLTFYDLNQGEVKKFDVEAVSRVPARDAGLESSVIHTHADGSQHVHSNVGEQVGIYTAMVNFDAPGEWGVEIDVQKGDLRQVIKPRFNVATETRTPALGADAPRSRNLTADDTTDITQIDSSDKPAREMHTATIADTIAAGKPALLLFAVPGFCTSQLCGPEMEIMRKLYPAYNSRVEFIHVEFYKTPGDPRSDVADAAKEFGLRTEPWFFAIDSRGKVVAKFEGPTSMQELEETLRALQ
jgi:hypothetical protein